MAKLPDAQLSHIGLRVGNLALMIAFYERALGLVLTDKGSLGGRDLAFLSRNPEEHHQVVMVHDPASREPLSSAQQISFKLKTLEDLRTFYAELQAQKITGLDARDHGNSWSLYFFDPEGNKIELYLPTPWHVSQPWRAALDLAMPADAILAQTAQRMKENPTSLPVAEWTAAMRERLA